jgi:hypothetical protein
MLDDLSAIGMDVANTNINIENTASDTTTSISVNPPRSVRFRFIKSTPAYTNPNSTMNFFLIPLGFSTENSAGVIGLYKNKNGSRVIPEPSY